MGEDGKGQDATLVVEALEGRKVIETYDDLEAASPGEVVMVGLPSPLADAVWVWAAHIEDETPGGEMARAMRDLILGFYRSDYASIIGAIRELDAAFQEFLTQATRPGAPAAETPGT